MFGGMTRIPESQAPNVRSGNVRAEVRFWINGKEAASGTVRRTIPLSFTASETFDVGLDTCSPVADAYFEKAPFAFEGKLKRLYFQNLETQKP
jgi:arylsulfatase